MTLFQIIQILKEIALAQPNIKSATDGSIYDIMNTNPSVKYDVVHFSQTTHQSDEETDFYGLNIFYVSRLEDSLEDNRLQIQSIGKEILDNIIRTFCENWNIDFPVITYTPFTQKFNDLCAGCYCNLRLEIPKEIICADDYIAEVVPGSGIKLQDIGITITQNGLIVVTPDAEYDGIGEIRIETNVPQSAAVLQDKEVEYTENGSYSIHPDPAYDGLSSVSVDVLVPDNYDEGYDDGKRDGEAEQRAKLTVTSFTENNTYTRENGWSAVTVDVPSDYQDGYDDGFKDGEEAQKGKLSSLSVNQNGTFTRENGWSAITVDVPTTGDRYEEGYEDGQSAQKMKLSSITITENGEYNREDGYSAITVNVPQTGSSNEDLIANLQGDYYIIPDGTDHLRQWAFYNTCFSSITIPNSVRIINAYAFANNTCLTSMTFPSSVTAIGSYVLCGDTALEEITFEGTTPPTLGNTGNSLGDTAYTFPIYVPCQSLDDYQNAFGSAYSPRIRCKGSELISAITLNVASAITDSGTATTTYSPSTAYTDIYYTSSDISKATINSITGVISAKANGTVTICTKDRLSGLQDCKSVSITKSPAPATSISINVPGTITDSATATTTVTPSSASTNLRYSSSDTGKATINATTGAISVKASGTVQFCVTDTISGLQSCKNANVRKAATAITINVPSTVTDSATATTTVSPTGATTNLTYTSSNTSRATINSTTGAITVKSNGSVQFCVKDSISNKQSCKTVNVVKSPVPATSITINVPTTVTDSATATTTVNPSTADTNITYTSSDTSIATVSSNGVITAKGNGTVTICAKDLISGLQSCKTITVRKSATALNYTADTSTVDNTGETRTITYDATGFNANSFGISISGATGATYTKNGNVYTITFPDNPSTSERDYVVTLTATTYGGATKSATLYYTQEGKPAIVGRVMVIYNVTSKTKPTVVATTDLAPYFTSVTVGGNTYPLPTTDGNGFTIMDRNGYKALGYTFSATGKQNITYNVGPNSPLVTGVYPSSDTDMSGEGHFPFLLSLYSGYTTDDLVQANAAVEVNIGSGIKNIPADFFSDKCGYCGDLKLTAVTMANGVTYIGSGAFLGQHYLNSEIKIPASVTGIGQQLFYWTEAGTNTQGTSLPGARFTLKFLGTTPPTIKSTSFVVNANNKVMSNTIKVPSSAVNAYKTTGNWTYYANNIVGY